LAEIAPKDGGHGMNAHANGGLLLESLKIPNFRDFAVKIEAVARKILIHAHPGQLLHAVMERTRHRKISVSLDR